MSTVAWTLKDLAVYCEYCIVIAIAEDDKYCNDCANDIVEYLAERFEENNNVENGWY